MHGYIKNYMHTICILKRKQLLIVNKQVVSNIYKDLSFIKYMSLLNLFLNFPFHKVNEMNKILIENRL